MKRSMIGLGFLFAASTFAAGTAVADGGSYICVGQGCNIPQVQPQITHNSPLAGGTTAHTQSHYTAPTQQPYPAGHPNAAARSHFVTPPVSPANTHQHMGQRTVAVQRSGAVQRPVHRQHVQVQRPAHQQVARQPVQVQRRAPTQGYVTHQSTTTYGQPVQRPVQRHVQRPTQTYAAPQQGYTLPQSHHTTQQRNAHLCATSATSPCAQTRSAQRTTHSAPHQPTVRHHNYTTQPSRY